jgi:hypothetical protein
MPFRRLYTAATNRLNHPDATPDIAPFDMDTTPFRPTTPNWPRAIVTPTVAAIPALLTVSILTTWTIQTITQ